jgi:Xaa-Pro dipeptidase
VRDPGCFGAIEVSSGRTVLFVPRLPASYAVWMGRIRSASEMAGFFGLDEGAYADELGSYLTSAGVRQLLVLRGINTDSGSEHAPATVPEGGAFDVDDELLFPALIEARVFKSEREIDVLRRAVRCTSEGHLLMMRHARAGMREDQLEALYKFWVHFHAGMRLPSYTYICGSGPNGAVLHYGHSGAPNDRVMAAGDMVLCDCGNELHFYASDITTTFPIGGAFSPEQRIAYEAVLSALNAVESSMRPGVCWRDMHTLAYRRILEHLVRHDVVRGDVDAMLAPEVNLGAVFMPHGLGHLIGCDTHDVGG